jgi:hypothetical protein
MPHVVPNSALGLRLRHGLGTTPGTRRHVVDRVRAEGVDRRRRGKDRRAREESGELRTVVVIEHRRILS